MPKLPLRRLLIVVAAVLLAAGLSSGASAQPTLQPGGGLPGGGSGGSGSGGSGPAGGGGRPPPLPTPERAPEIALTEPMWVAMHGQPTGPFEPPVIAQKIMAREILGETLVYTASMSGWLPASSVAALQPLLRQAAASAGGRGMPPAPPPLPPPGNDREAIQRLTQFVVGEWLVETPGMYPGITVRVQTRYFADGTYRGFHALVGSVGGAPATQSRPLVGRWTVQPLDDRRFMLQLMGGQEAGTATLEILDPNRLRNFQEGYIAIRIGR